MFPGDSTLECTKLSIEELSKDENADERIVIVLSDANFDRYGTILSCAAIALIYSSVGIPASQMGKLMSVDDVIVFAVFIGSLGDQAERLRKQLPAGHAYVCQKTADMPNIIKQIFTATLLSNTKDAS